MNADTIRIRIYELKYEREKYRVEKKKAVEIQNFDDAIKFRDLENSADNKLQEIRKNVIKLVNECAFNTQNLLYYIELNEFLLELDTVLHPLDFHELKNEDYLKSKLNLAWEMRENFINQMNEKMRLEYCSLTNRRAKFIYEEKHKEAEYLYEDLKGLLRLMKDFNSK